MVMTRAAVALAAVALFACGPASAQTVPKEMAWTAYDTGSSGFNIAAAISRAIQESVRLGRAPTARRATTPAG